MIGLEDKYDGVKCHSQVRNTSLQSEKITILSLSNPGFFRNRITHLYRFRPLKAIQNSQFDVHYKSIISLSPGRRVLELKDLFPVSGSDWPDLRSSITCFFFVDPIKVRALLPYLSPSGLLMACGFPPYLSHFRFSQYLACIT